MTCFQLPLTVLICLRLSGGVGLNKSFLVTDFCFERSFFKHCERNGLIANYHMQKNISICYKRGACDRTGFSGKARELKEIVNMKKFTAELSSTSNTHLIDISIVSFYRLNDLDKKTVRNCK